MATSVPGGLLVGAKPEMTAGRKKLALLVWLPSVVVTLIGPVVAPAGTFALNWPKLTSEGGAA